MGMAVVLLMAVVVVVAVCSGYPHEEAAVDGGGNINGFD